jgi:hypothetical protein
LVNDALVEVTHVLFRARLFDDEGLFWDGLLLSGAALSAGARGESGMFQQIEKGGFAT